MMNQSMSTFDKILQAVTAAVAVAALIVAIRSSRDNADSPPDRPRAGESSRVRAGNGDGPGTQAGDSTDGNNASPEMRALQERLASAERHIAEIERKATPGTGEPPPPSTAAEEDVKAWTASAVDPSVHPATRLGALKQLRRRSPASRSGPVASAMIDLMRASNDPVIRGEIARYLHGVTDTVVKDEMLNRLRADEDEEVRDEAAECLDTMLDDPAVVLALEWSRDHDPSESVRRRAAEALAKVRK